MAQVTIQTIVYAVVFCACLAGEYFHLLPPGTAISFLTGMFIGHQTQQIVQVRNALSTPSDPTSKGPSN